MLRFGVAICADWIFRVGQHINEPSFNFILQNKSVLCKYMLEPKFEPIGQMPYADIANHVLWRRYNSLRLH